MIQEVALAAVRQSSPIADSSKVAPWLYRLAIRYVLLYRRKMGRTRKLLDRYAQRYRPSPSDDHVEANPLAWLLSEERRELVRRALQQLRGGDVEILMLKYTENWSYRAIAEHLAVSNRGRSPFAPGPRAAPYHVGKFRNEDCREITC